MASCPTCGAAMLTERPHVHRETDRSEAVAPPTTDEERAYNRGWAAGNASALDACNPIIERLQTALRVANHSPHDQAGEPNEGFPTCSVCGAIQTDLRPEREETGLRGECGLAGPASMPAIARLTTHELTVLRAWAAGINRESRDLVERVIDEAERSRFALNEIAIHLEGLQHVRKLTGSEQAILVQARDGLS